ncbi:MAG: ATP-binding cassette domain-containing protein [Candidatus Omnitrophica bacterium]|nr:ATP-binding cassette domain-containing protein [Candidatus Omnitrophota bacterium]
MPNTAARGDVLLSLSRVERVFTLPSGKPLPVLSDITLTFQEGELVAILGPSGCGKSTLIRIAAGLLPPNAGEVRYRGQLVTEPNPHVALVFQQFALFPWLTVAQNIEQALIPRGVDSETRRHRVAEVITVIGLDGFEEAYPRELSGGMKQRVGIARALVVQPELLCMDEPFSQVDALTAETLRNEVVNLWRDREKYPQAICMVSHDIHEVAFMANRILIMTAHPGRIKTVIENSLPYPRDPRSSAYQAFVDKLHAVITGLYLPEKEPPQVTLMPGTLGIRVMAPLPSVEVREIVGLLEALQVRGGDVEFFRLTSELGRTFTRILLAVKAAELLALLESPQGHLILTEFGRVFVSSPRKIRRQLFRQQLSQVPLVKRVREMMEHSPDRHLAKDVLLEELAIQCPQEDPKRLLRILINWGRFADLWVYHAAAGTLTPNGNQRHSAPRAAQDPVSPGIH